MSNKEIALNQIPANYSVTNMLEGVFDTIYVADDLDIKDVLEGNRSKKFRRLASFFGLPNRVQDEKEDLSLKNLAYNFIGYQPNVSTSKKVINFIIMPLRFLFNLISVPVKFATNIAKLFTEFLPAMLTGFINLAILKLNDIAASETTHKSKRILAKIVSKIAGLGGLILSQVYFLGRAITSPIDAVKENWLAGKKSSAEMGFLLAALSALTTFTFFVVCFPLAIKAISTPALTLLTKYAPKAFTELLHHAAVVLEPILTKIGKAIGPAAKWIVDMISFGSAHIPAGTTPATIALVSMAGAGVPTVGVALSEGLHKLQSWWHKPQSENKLYMLEIEEESESNTINAIVSAADSNKKRRGVIVNTNSRVRETLSSNPTTPVGSLGDSDYMNKLNAAKKVPIVSSPKKTDELSSQPVSISNVSVLNSSPKPSYIPPVSEPIPIANQKRRRGNGG